MSEPRLAIVPAYNEEATVATVVRAINTQAPEFDVLVVDDGSIDRTARVARAAGAMVLRHPFNLGIGGAVQSGYKFAIEHDYGLAVQVDGDGQHEASHINDLVDVIREEPAVDMVCGSRFVEETDYKAPVNRRLGMILFSKLLSLIVRRKVTDPTSGFRLVNRRGIELFVHDYPHDYPEVEAILMVHAHRLRLKEVPVRMHPRGGGTSSITTGQSAYYMAKVLLAVFVGLFRRWPAVESGGETSMSSKREI